MEFFIQILIASVVMGTPLLFATLGGVISERAGVINLGMEGLMLVGALVAFVVMLNTGNYFFAVAAAALASAPTNPQLAASAPCCCLCLLF